MGLPSVLFLIQVQEANGAGGEREADQVATNEVGSEVETDVKENEPSAHRYKQGRYHHQNT